MDTINFQRYEQEGRSFLAEVARELEAPEDLAHAQRVFTAVMHTLRERITPEEWLDLISQLPRYIKTLCIEGWRISGKVNRLKTQEEFLQEVRGQLPRTAGRDLGDIQSTRKKAEAVFHVLHQHVSEGELKDIKAQLPDTLAELLEAGLPH
jgi:uncharacterized protein (DUF2267 family)